MDMDPRQRESSRKTQNQKLDNILGPMSRRDKLLQHDAYALA
jgi:hypothetical protein